MRRSGLVSARELRVRIKEAVRQIVDEMFGMSVEEAEQRLRSLAQHGEGDDLFKAALVYKLNELVESGITGGQKGCTEEQLNQVLVNLRKGAPQVASTVRKELKELQKRLPRRGGPGRGSILSDTEKRQACDLIASRIKCGQNKKISDIFKCVSGTFATAGKQVSERTIKRIWENRLALYDD